MVSGRPATIQLWQRGDRGFLRELLARRLPTNAVPTVVLVHGGFANLTRDAIKTIAR